VKPNYKKIPLTTAYWFQKGPGVRNWQFKNSGIKLLNVGNILKSGQIDLTKTDRYLDPTEVSEKYRHFLVDEGDLVIASSGISIDDDQLLRTRGAFIENHHLPLCLNTSTIRFKAKKEISSIRFLKHWLNSREFRVQITREVTGIAQKNFGPSHLKRLKISLPPLEVQEHIADILDKADAIRRKRRQAIQLAEEFLRSVFLDMFGDPAINQKGWERKKIKKLGKVVTGNTPSRQIPENYGDHIEWIKSDNINTPSHILTRAEEGLSRTGEKIGRLVPANSTLVTCIADSPECIGNAALSDRKVAFNQQINAIVPFDYVDPYFLYLLVLMSKKIIQRASTNSMKGMVSKGIFQEIELISPPYNLQKKFGNYFYTYFNNIDKKDLQLKESDNLFNSLCQKAFRGEL
jgi:type I restriction enzyme S subunit